MRRRADVIKAVVDVHAPLPRVAGVLFDGRWRILVSILAWTALAVTYAVVCTPVYRAEVLLVPASSRDSDGLLDGISAQVTGLAALAGVDLTQDDLTIEALAILKSREFTRQFIRRHDIASKLAPDPWLRLPWQSSEALTAERRLRAAVDVFDRRVRRIEQDTRTGLVTLMIDWRDPQEAATWANDLVSALNAEVRARTIRETTQNLKYLEDELNKTRIVGVERAIFRIVEAQVNRRMLASANQEVAFKVIDPAVIPDENDRVWPRRTLIVIVGLALGALMGVMIVLVPDGLRRIVALARASARARSKRE